MSIWCLSPGSYLHFKLQNTSRNKHNNLMLLTPRKFISVLSVLLIVAVIFWLESDEESLIVTTTEMEEEESEEPEQYREEKLWDEFDPNEVKTDKDIFFISVSG